MTRELQALHDREVRRRPQQDDPAYRLEQDGPVLRLVGPGPAAFENTVVWADLDAASADAAIARQVAHFAGLGRAFEWKHFEHDRPTDLAARLARAGFVAGDDETLVALEVARHAPSRPPPAGVEVRRLVAPGALEPLVDLHVDVYGDPTAARWLVDSLRSELAAAPGSLGVWAHSRATGRSRPAGAATRARAAGAACGAARPARPGAAAASTRRSSTRAWPRPAGAAAPGWPSTAGP